MKNKQRKRIITLIILLAILLSSIFLLPNFLYHQNNDLELSTYSVSSTKLPAAFKGYKIVFLSDLHINESSLYDSVVEKCRGLKPDIIIISGDIVESSTSELDYYENSVATFAKKISTVAPVYWVTGNYEASLSPTNFATLVTKLNSCGFHYLNNSTVSIKRDGQKINLCGINDPLFGIENIFKYPVDDVTTIKSYLSQALPQNYKENYTILVSHRTEYCNLLSDSNVELILTGHAHGGQIRLPLVGALFAPGQGISPKYTSGQFAINSSQLIINRGIGASRFKQRLFNQPEIILIQF